MKRFTRHTSPSRESNMSYRTSNESDNTSLMPVVRDDSAINHRVYENTQLPRYKETIFGQRRYLRDTVTNERIFWGSCWIMLLTSCVYSIYRMASLPRDSPDFALALILFVNTVFSFEHSWHGVLKQRALQIFVLCLATVLVCLHIVIHFILGDKSSSEVVRLVISCSGGLLIVFLGSRLVHKYQTEMQIFFVFNVVRNAFKHKQVLFTRYLLFLESLKFNAQLLITLVVLSVSSRRSFLQNVEEMVITIILLILITLFGLFGYFSMSRESHRCSQAFFFLGLLEMIYIFYMLIRVSTTEPGSKDRYLEVCTCVCGPLAAFFLGIIMIVAWYMYNDFGDGLREILNRQFEGNDTQRLLPTEE